MHSKVYSITVCGGPKRTAISIVILWILGGCEHLYCYMLFSSSPGCLQIMLWLD